MSEAFPEASAQGLQSGDVHVWKLGGSSPLAAAEASFACLSASEIARAERLAGSDARARFLASRAALRYILARYAGVAAASLDVVTEPHGKPVLDPALHVHFSLSHSRDTTLIAVARTPVGVDVEHIREPRHLERTARRVLHPSTCELLARLPPHRRSSVFLQAWTEREAHVKAVGGGLFRTPDTLPFSGAEAAAARVRHVRDRVDGSLWGLARIDAGAHAVAALAARGEVHSLTFMSWNCDTMEISNG